MPEITIVAVSPVTSVVIAIVTAATPILVLSEDDD
jgi:hypothetical protein